MFRPALMFSAMGTQYLLLMSFCASSRALALTVHERRLSLFSICSPPSQWGLLDLKVNVVLARGLEYSCSAPPQRIPAVPNCKASLQCLTAKYPCSAEPPSILAVPNRRVSLQCQPQSIPAVPNHQVSLQCPSAKYPCSAQAPSIPAVPNL